MSAEEPEEPEDASTEEPANETGGSGTVEGTAPAPREVTVYLTGGGDAEVENVVEIQTADDGSLTLIRPATGEQPDAWFRDYVGIDPDEAEDERDDEAKEVEREDAGGQVERNERDGGPPPWSTRGR